MFRYVRQVLTGAALLLAMATSGAWAQQMNVDVNSPAITAVKQRMQERHRQLSGLYESGAVGLQKDGSITIRLIGNIPPAQRQGAAAVVDAENNDRAILYREVARANNHPEWEPQIRETFALRWQQKMRSQGWWFQDELGTWKKK